MIGSVVLHAMQRRSITCGLITSRLLLAFVALVFVMNAIVMSQDEAPVRLPRVEPVDVLLVDYEREPSQTQDATEEASFLITPGESQSDNARFAAMEKRIKELERGWQKSVAAEEAKQVEASKKPSFRIGGQVQVDSIWFAQDAESRTQVGDIQDALDFRRARLVTQGEAFDVFNYALGMDFALGTATNGRPQFLDVFIGVKDLPWVNNLRVGHFFEPFSLERITQNRYNTFMERSLADTFAPARNTGVMIYDQIDSQNATWALGAFRSNGDNFGDDSGDQEGGAITGRTTWLPWYDEASDGRGYLHLGSAYSFRDAADGRVRYQSRPEVFARQDNLITNVVPFVETGELAINHSQLYGLEAAMVWGAFSVQSEYMMVPVDRIGAENVTFHAGYIYASYFLTGEHRPYIRESGIMGRVKPFENFFRVQDGDGLICNGLGAWEIAARASRVDLSERDIQGGELTDYTVTLNWYLTPYHRVKAEYIHAHLERPANVDGNTGIYGIRVDMDF